MNIHVHFDTSAKRLYVNKTAGILFLLGFFVLVGAFVYFLSTGILGSRGKLILPFQDTKTLPKFSDSSSQKIAGVATSAAEIAKNVISSEHANKLTIVFFYDGYSDQNQAIADIQVLKEALKLIQPFKSMHDTLAYKIFTTDSPKCHVEGYEKKIFICDKSLIESFQKLGIDHIKVVIVSPQLFDSAGEFARGKNSWITISTFQGALQRDEFKRWLGIIFTQNLGRSLGLKNEFSELKDSYFPSESQRASSEFPAKDLAAARPNCAPDLPTAEKWWGNLVSSSSASASGSATVNYFNGCAGSRDYIYPEKNTLMSEDPQKESYGIVSEQYLRGVLSCFYGNKTGISYPAGEKKGVVSCTEFKKLYPNFWKE